jgi:hypothetical protein
VLAAKQADAWQPGRSYAVMRLWQEDVLPPRSLAVAAPRGGPRSGPAEPDPRETLV